MTVSAVCCSRFGSGSMVISPITQCFIKLCVETALQELRYRFPEQPLDILYTSNVRVAQQLSDQLSSCLFLRCSFSAHFFFLHSFCFYYIHCLWSLHKICGGPYNSDNSVTKTKEDRSGNFYFSPQVPVYAGSSGTWGNQKWTDFYLIGFAIDDISGVYYGKYYVHVYTKNENGSVSLITDYYSLSDGSLYQTKKGTWDIGNYPYLSMHYATGSSMFSFRGYKSASAYYGDVTSSWKTIVTSNVAMPLSASDNSGTLEFTKYVALPSFTPDTNKSDDYGFICSSKPFELFANQTGIDFQKIPDNYIITINGDTIYNYPITDPSTGNSSTINNLIINNYIIPGYPEAPDPDGPITSGLYGVKVSGNVKVDGEINIKADPIQIKTDPIDINVNVNHGGGSGGSGTSEHVDISGYLDTLPEQSQTLTDYLKIFFDFLPPQLLAVLLGGIGAAVLCRVLGR